MKPTEKLDDQRGGFASGAWLGVCAGCGAEIIRTKQVRPQNAKMLKCRKCKDQKHREYAAKWMRGHSHIENARRQRPDVKRKRLDYNLDRNRIVAKNATLAGRKWCLVDESYLIENTNKMTNKQMAEALGRSILSVEAKLGRLRKTPNS